MWDQDVSHTLRTSGPDLFLNPSSRGAELSAGGRGFYLRSLLIGFLAQVFAAGGVLFHC